MDQFGVYRCCKIIHKSLQDFGDAPEKDMIWATPSKFLKKTWRSQGAGHFDTALIDMNGTAGKFGMEGITVVQIWVIFKVPKQLSHYPHPLIYVEFFSGSQVLAANTKMYQVHCAYWCGCKKAAVIWLDHIQSGYHLIPKFGTEIDSIWTSQNIWEKCNNFYVNTYLSPHFFQVLLEPSVLDEPPLAAQLWVTSHHT